MPLTERSHLPNRRVVEAEWPVCPTLDTAGLMMKGHLSRSRHHSLGVGCPWGS